MKCGVVSGIRFPGLLQVDEKISVETMYGAVEMEVSQVEDHMVFFVHRHGSDASVPPHKIEYRAVIQAFASAHVDALFSINTVGSLNTNMQPGDFVVPHDFIDMTKNRVYSFFDDRRVHVDMTEAFCPGLRKLLMDVGNNMKGVEVHREGVYLATEGPRLETPAEIRMFQSVADVVGMTLVPEVVLAREKGLCFGSLCVVVNMAAGLQKSLSTAEICQVVDERKPVVEEVLRRAFKQLSDMPSCSCCNIDSSQASL